MPLRSIQNQHDLLVGTGPGLTREFCQFHFKDGNADGGGLMKDRATRGRMDAADQVAQMLHGEAMLHGATGHRPIGARMRQSNGFKPIRCSSVAHNSTRAGEMCGDRLQQRS